MLDYEITEIPRFLESKVKAWKKKKTVKDIGQ
jgi:hypothetical protein